MAAAVLTFYVPLHLYKSLNYKYNHQYALTDRGGWMLYGTAAKRTNPEAIAKLPAAFAYNLGDNVCPRFFPKEDCDYWPFATSDNYGMGKMFELSAQGLSSEQVNKKLFSLSKDLILAHPLQYFLVMGVESIKFVFWESTKMGCVNYPPALADLFDNHMFKDPVRLIVSLLTLIAVIYIFVYLIRSRKEIFTLKDPGNPAVFIAFISYFLLIFAGFHCLFSVITRYMLPIAPLYLILIAFTFSTLSSKQK
jgi:ABC-type multidrug transport system fused ATPase/permease subunit